ncbi:hypothetical protein PENTCL1PPCAC_5471, partial [Pristionchus entomophagus]
IITSVVSIVLVLYTAHRYLHRTIFENVTKELIVSLYVFIVIYSVCLILAQGSQLTYRYIARDKCDAQVPKAWCILRYIITVTACSFVIIHIGMTALHALSSFHFGSRTQKVTARVSILLAFVYPAIYGIMAYHKDSLEGRTAYCSGFTANSESVLMFNVYLVLVLDVLNALASFVLWKYNQHKLNTEQSFNLSITFNRRQNLEAMRQFLPVAALHAVVYVVFFLTVCFGQAIRSSMSPGWYLFTSAVANVIPHYCFLCPLIFLILIRKGKFDRKAEV